MARSFEDKYDQILRHWRDRSGTVELDAELETCLNRWLTVRTWLLAAPNETDRYYIDRIEEEFDVKERTAWQLLKDTRRFFADVDTVNTQYERLMQIADLRLRIKAFSLAGDGKAEMAARKLLAELTGTTRPDDDAGNKGNTTIINMLVCDPSLLGAKEMPNVDQIILELQAEDEEKSRQL